MIILFVVIKCCDRPFSSGGSLPRRSDPSQPKQRNVPKAEYTDLSTFFMERWHQAPVVSSKHAVTVSFSVCHHIHLLSLLCQPTRCSLVSFASFIAWKLFPSSNTLINQNKQGIFQSSLPDYQPEEKQSEKEAIIETRFVILPNPSSRLHSGLQRLSAMSFVCSLAYIVSTFLNWRRQILCDRVLYHLRLWCAISVWNLCLYSLSMWLQPIQ